MYWKFFRYTKSKLRLHAFNETKTLLRQFLLHGDCHKNINKDHLHVVSRALPGMPHVATSSIDFLSTFKCFVITYFLRWYRFYRFMNDVYIFLVIYIHVIWSDNMLTIRSLMRHIILKPKTSFVPLIKYNWWLFHF